MKQTHLYLLLICMLIQNKKVIALIFTPIDQIIQHISIIEDQPIHIKQKFVEQENQLSEKKSQSNDKKIITLFSHGLANTGKQVQNYVKKKQLINYPFTTFNYPDATKRFWRVNFWKTNLGQSNDVKALEQAYQNISESNNNNIILFGISRGAVTILNFMAKYNPENIKAIVVESPFDHVKSVAKHIAQQSKLGFTPKTIHWIMSKIYTKYKPNGMQAIHLISKINKNVPILIICSKQDQIVPWDSSFKLYKKLREAGHKKSHILVVNHGKHDNILPGKDGTMYQCVVHAFYKKYALPYNHEYVQYGEEILTQCQPNINTTNFLQT